MKTIRHILTVIATSVILPSCNPYWNWPPFPNERFGAYSPYNLYDEISFYSDKYDTISFQIQKGLLFEQDKNFGSSNYGWEFAHLETILVNDSIKILYICDASGRKSFGVGCAFFKYNKQISYDDHRWYTSNKEDFTLLLIDTITITGENKHCVILNGKGLIEYSVDGTVWKLIE
jgi:hypothetical protein